MITLISLALLLALTAIFSYRWRWGIYTLIFCLPFERIGSWALHPDTGHPVVRLSQIVAAALVLGVAYNVLNKKLRLTKPPIAFYILLAFVASSGLSALFIGKPQLLASCAVLVLLLLVVLILGSFISAIRPEPLLNALYSSSAAVGLFGLYQFAVGSLHLGLYSGLRAPYLSDLFGFPRIHSTALEPLYYANYLLIPLLVGVALMVLNPVAMKGWHRAVWGLVALNFILTMSRGAFIGLLVATALGALIFSILKLKSRIPRFLPLSVIAIPAVAVILIASASFITTGSAKTGPRNFIEQMTTKLAATGSYYDRVAMRERAYEIFKDHPVFGVGTAGITPYVHNYDPQRRKDDVVALNNQFFELLAETGIVGTVLFYGFLISLLAAAVLSLRLVSKERAAWTLGLVLVIVAMTVQAQSFSGFLLMHFWVCYGLLLGLIKKPFLHV